jgi:hypothetical protein
VKLKNMRLILSLMLMACSSYAFAGNGKGNGINDECQGLSQQQCQQQQQEQQQQQQQQASAEASCKVVANALGWKDDTARFVCAQAKNPALPVLCVVYAQATPGWPTDGTDWPYTGLLCRSAVSPIEPIECAKKARAKGWPWTQTVEACQGVSSAALRLQCIDQHISEGHMSWVQIVGACK